MNMYEIIFYLFAIITVVSAFFVVTVRNIVHSAFFLLFTLFGIAGLFVLLNADFVGIIQLIIYVGGILILLLFGVMLTNKITNVQIKTGTVQLLPAAIGTGLFAGFLIAVLTKNDWNAKAQITLNEITTLTMSNLGQLLLTQYAVVFELLGILLLIALIGAASMARR